MQFKYFHCKDISGFQPIHYAALKLSVKSFELFLKHKINMTGITSSSNETIITIMGSQVDSNPEVNRQQFEEIMELLVRHQAITRPLATLNSSQGKRQSPLHYVVMYSDKKHVEAIGRMIFELFKYV